MEDLIPFNPEIVGSGTNNLPVFCGWMLVVSVIFSSKNGSKWWLSLMGKKSKIEILRIWKNFGKWRCFRHIWKSRCIMQTWMKNSNVKFSTKLPSNLEISIPIDWSNYFKSNIPCAKTLFQSYKIFLFCQK